MTFWALGQYRHAGMNAGPITLVLPYRMALQVDITDSGSRADHPIGVWVSVDSMGHRLDNVAKGEIDAGKLTISPKQIKCLSAVEILR
jgi:hypothetical protein